VWSPGFLLLFFGGFFFFFSFFGGGFFLFLGGWAPQVAYQGSGDYNRGRVLRAAHGAHRGPSESTSGCARRCFAAVIAAPTSPTRTWRSAANAHPIKGAWPADRLARPQGVTPAQTKGGHEDQRPAAVMDQPLPPRGGRRALPSGLQVPSGWADENGLHAIERTWRRRAIWRTSLVRRHARTSFHHR